MKRTSFFLVLVLEVLVGHHRMFSFSFFFIIGWGMDLDYCDIEWFALEMNRFILSFLRWHPSTAFWTLLLTMMATPFLLRDSCLFNIGDWNAKVGSPEITWSNIQTWPWLTK